MNRSIAILLGLTALAAANPGKPNIVIILADDIGYGDFGCYGATKISTPNIDKVAAAGMRFTDGYATASTCTPTRFALLTGRYAWRQAGTAILPGNAPALIAEGTPTVGSLLQQAGYHTGIVGKWHLGLGREGPTDYNKEIDVGPRTAGFDYSFIIPATGDRVPCVYLEDHKVVNYDPADPILLDFKSNIGDSPTAKTRPELVRPDHRGPDEIRAGTIINGICRIGFMTGGRTALWQDDSIADTLVNKAVTFLEKNRNDPFFLYLSTHDVHAPLAPNPRFLGTSQSGKRGDTAQQFDWCVGQVTATLDRLGLTDNTLLLIASDNGGGQEYQWQEQEFGHRVNGPLRGYKVTQYEGGVRVPFIVRWPGKVPPSVCHQTVALVDCLATMAAIAEVPLPPAAGPDSFNFLPTLLDPTKPTRDHLITQGGVASNPQCARQIRVGNWKLITNPKEPAKSELYNLETDPGEQHNLAAGQPELVADLTRRLAEATGAGHTRP